MIKQVVHTTKNTHKPSKRKGTIMIVENIYVFQYETLEGRWVDSPIIAYDYEIARLMCWKKHRRPYRLMEVIKPIETKE